MKVFKVFECVSKIHTWHVSFKLNTERKKLPISQHKVTSKKCYRRV